jgi:hypothetical protein
MRAAVAMAAAVPLQSKTTFSLLVRQSRAKSMLTALTLTQEAFKKS